MKLLKKLQARGTTILVISHNADAIGQCADRLIVIDEGKKAIVSNLIDEAVYLEGQLAELKKYPFIKFHPKNPNLQKITAAGKQYREFLQTYTNIMDKLAKVYGKDEGEEESPLRAAVKEMKKKFGAEVL